MKTKFDKVKISGICVSVPEHKICIDDELESVFQNDTKILKRMKKVIGLNTRYICDENTCVSDLGKHASNALLEGLNIDKNSLDALIVVTQSPDFFMPSTACYLHHLLNLDSKTIAFDLGQACAGYLYGLFVAHSLIQSGAMSKILLICGDTLSKFIHPKNINTAPIFGDGVSATLLEKTDFNEAFFKLASDGKHFDKLIIPKGAMRIPHANIFNNDSLMQTEEFRQLENLYMDGANIFNMALEHEPNSFKEILEFSKIKEKDIAFHLFHQSNTYLVDCIKEELKLNDDKVPNFIMEKYANLSACSLPALLCELDTPKEFKASLSAFGAGLSWGSAVLNFKDLYTKDILIYTKEK